ncbi:MULTISPECIES: response regulator [Clostridium]|jgi:two-component system chemotaxis response regulator CheY|uniref:Stage 0 sporulation protein A homolog n=1 Tax=Clostridium saccharoperbutylacetonicum N1-4(HMT) TaxID=931276 RepID=M1MJ17_9CLOT|nr:MULTISPECIES: response regulator [Clostridium]AGF56308.1 response regulator receiver protein [Clostridium saccharoperbutylacetonicum N1-4(HMT)]AQR95048.1 CAI-1 autoinducer sensor kinase/phosphatase CqsS [Clostridium saccharoperbutylacetonicum]NRT62948.1 two-component system chemotaxis response regulator CheY [Clostridium saccharoperbutylacetonicum]NSB26305.1 two-component system chemotaxis response regulator CheY [Clostridium saccharoperbutylacetonicum]NSB30895.1 two-component system chemot
MRESEKNILLIDDSASIRMFIRGLLEDENYNVYEAINGEDGLVKFKELGNIDLVITDIYMPKKSGLEFVVDLREKDKQTKVIVLSDGGQYNFSNELGVVEALGATTFLKKDLIKDELISKVKEIIS